METPTLLILADDVTGMADCAARCRKAGMSATIWLQTPDEAKLQGAAAFTSDSRHLDPDEAAVSVQRLVRRLTGVKGAIWYKKIDSTLRGNLGAELDAMLDALAEAGGPCCAVVSPAFPAQRRGIEGGYLVHAGTPSQTVHLPTLLASQSRRAVAVLELPTVRAGKAALATALRTEQEMGAEIFAVDGMTDADIESTLAAAQEALPDALLCGSAGLIGVLARRLTGASSFASAPNPTRLAFASPIAVVVGSGSPMARRQTEYLVAHLAISRLILTANGYQETARDAALHGNWLVHLPEPLPGTNLEGPAARELAARLADEVMNLVAQRPPAVLILVGGDTATTVLHKLGVDRLDVLSELQPGIPLSIGEGADGREIAVVLKAGNHGAEATLAELVEMLHSYRSLS